MADTPKGTEALTEGDKDERKPTSALDEEAMFLRLKRWITQDARSQKNWRTEARKDFAFESGDQWTEQDRAYLKEQLRPIITFNRTKATISAVTGMEVNNRQEVRFIPRTEDDAGVDESFTEAARWVRDECDAEDEESDMFGDDCVCGVGVSETSIEYQTDPDGMIAIDHRDPMEMIWDCSSVKRNMADARRVAHAPSVDIEKARDMFPDFTDAELNAGWLAEDWEANDSDAIDQEKSRQYRSGNNEITDYKEVKIVRIQWYEDEPYHRVANPVSGKIEEVDHAKFPAMKKAMEARGMPIIAVQQKRRKYYQAYLGDKLLDWGDAPSQKDFTFQFVTGYRDKNKKQWYGLVRLMRDPQLWANKLFSTIQHIISTAGKGIMAESSAFENPREAEAAWAKPDSITMMADGAISGNKVAPKPGAMLPAQITQMLEFVVSGIRDVTGINLEVLGLADRDQAASLEAQRRQAAVTILASFFSALRLYRKRQGRLLLDMIRTYISDGRLIRVLGDTGRKYIPLMKSDDVVEYDVIVDEAATSPNQKEATWGFIQGFIPVLQELHLPLSVWEQILKLSPIPNSAVEKIMAALKEQSQQPPPPDPAMLIAQEKTKQIQMQTQAQGQKAQAEQQQSQVDLQVGQATAQAKTMQAMGDLETQQRSAELDHIAQINDIQAKRELAQVEIAKAMAMSQIAQKNAKAKPTGEARK